jgi:hypothetical protein
LCFFDFLAFFSFRAFFSLCRRFFSLRLHERGISQPAGSAVRSWLLPRGQRPGSGRAW